MSKRNNKKAKYDIKSTILKDYGIDVGEFILDPAQAVFDAAGDIGDRKGWGSEGVGQLCQEIWQELGVDYDNDDHEFLGEDDCKYTIDGIMPAAKEDVKACKEAKALKLFLVQETGGEIEGTKQIGVFEAVDAKAAAKMWLKSAGWDDIRALIDGPEDMTGDDRVLLLPVGKGFTYAEVRDDFESGNARALEVARIKIDQVYDMMSN